MGDSRATIITHVYRVGFRKTVQKGGAVQARQKPPEGVKPTRHLVLRS